MNHELKDEWAKSQVEAWVDGSLEGVPRERMKAALAESAELRAAVGRAAALRRALRASAVTPLPRGLRRRLLAIPGAERPSQRWLLAPLAAGAAALAGVWWLSMPAAPPATTLGAVQDFEIAMKYVQKSARIAHYQIAANVGAGLHDALAASRASLDRNTDEPGG